MVIIFMIFQIFIVIFGVGIFPRVTMMGRSHQVPIVIVNCCLLMRFYDKIMYLRDDICNNFIIIINLCFCACGNVKLHGL